MRDTAYFLNMLYLPLLLVFFCSFGCYAYEANFGWQEKVFAGWQEYSSYKKIRQEVASLSQYKPSRSIRLEMGNANEPFYGVAWLVDIKKEVVLLTNYIPDENGWLTDQIRKVTFPRDRFDRLWSFLKRKGAFDLPSDHSRQELIFDASTYFVSLYEENKSHQFEIYAEAEPLKDAQTEVVETIIATVEEFSR